MIGISCPASRLASSQRPPEPVVVPVEGLQADRGDQATVFVDVECDHPLDVPGTAGHDSEVAIDPAAPPPQGRQRFARADDPVDAPICRPEVYHDVFAAAPALNLLEAAETPLPNRIDVPDGRQLNRQLYHGLARGRAALAGRETDGGGEDGNAQEY